LKRATIAALNQALAARRPVAFAKNLTNGAEFILPDATAPPALNQAGLASLAADQTGTQIIEDQPWFIEARNPPPRLVVVDPRTGFGNADRFPGVAMVNDWPDEALDALQPDHRTAVVALSHDPKLDDLALDRALRSKAFYIGALGSRKTHAGRLQRLAALGHDEAALARIQGPVGLAIGAVTTPEIAISIVAALVAARRRK
jgi:xanthine dehydrogenase accessory factor